jgi:small-conductance mechanosensitive channel
MRARVIWMDRPPGLGAANDSIGFLPTGNARARPSPYGSLGSVRNNSRDWVIDKFEIPLSVSVDSERIRKLVKRIGVEMLEDAELAKIIDEPLKAKLYRIDPGVKIFRCKVQTPPGKQFEIRAEA